MTIILSALLVVTFTLCVVLHVRNKRVEKLLDRAHAAVDELLAAKVKQDALIAACVERLKKPRFSA